MKRAISPGYAVILILVTSLACSTSQLIPTLVPATPQPSTPTPPPTFTPAADTPTPTICPYMANPGPVPPEVETQAQEDFFALKIPGKLKVEAFGEYSCDHFGVEEIDYNYTLFVSDLSDQAALSALVSKVHDSAKNSLKGYNLGTISVLFQSGKECWWEEQQNACGTIGPIIH